MTGNEFLGIVIFATVTSIVLFLTALCICWGTDVLSIACHREPMSENEVCV